MTNSRDAALSLAKRGFRVFPLHSTSLRPTRKGWHDSASADLESVRATFTDPTGDSVSENIAVLTGGSLIAVDIDVKKGQPGVESFAELNHQCLLPDTFTVKTPSGGSHLYFSVDKGLAYPNRRNWRPGIDIRGEHGYVVAPGSTKVDGSGYEIVKDLPVAPLPAIFAQELSEPRRSPVEINVSIDSSYEDEWSINAAIEYLKTAEPDAGDGNRHIPLVSIGQQLFDWGITPATAALLIEEWWPEAINVTEDIAYQMATLADSRLKSPGSSPWGYEHPRRRPSVYLTFDRVELKDPKHEGPAEKPANDNKSAELFCAADFEGKEVPERLWLVPDIMPDRSVTMLSGDGGVGKSLLALQLGVAVAAGGGWLGLEPERGPVIYASAEDDIDEVHRRLNDIKRAQGLTFADLNHFYVLPLAGLDAVLGGPGKNGLIEPTPLWKRFVGMVQRVRPRMIVLDTLADVFGGDEIVRIQARQFVGQLRGLSIQFEMATLLLAHPSLSGMASGAGTSGSTAWNNSVRGRLYLTRPKEGEGRPDPNARVLTTKKENYSGGYGDEKRLRWEAGRFRVIDRNRVVIEGDADTLFMKLLAKFEEQGRAVSPSPSPLYAPSLFSQHAEGEGISLKTFRAAMERLLDGGRIKVETTGLPSKRRTRIVTARG